MRKRFGLIGKNIAYSRSPELFEKFFKELNVNAQYEIFDIPDHTYIKRILELPGLHGVNVTIPYKEAVSAYLDEISPEAKQIGAVNTVKVKDGKKYGYNTDVFGFEKSLLENLKPFHTKALILGNGATAKTVRYVLGKLNMDALTVSRNKTTGTITYDEVTPEVLKEYLLIVNTTPLGNLNYPGQKPDLAYKALTPEHLLFDLNYNPPLTPFLQAGLKAGADIKNGWSMLELQARKALEIWLG